jgi:hypothetical protein
MVEYGNPEPPLRSTRSKLVIRPLTEEAEAIRWATFALSIAVGITGLVCVGLLLMVFEFRLDRSFRCVLRPADERTSTFFIISNTLLAVAVIVYAVFLVRFGLILKRQQGWRSFYYYAVWFHMRIKMVFASYVALIVMAVVPPFLVSYRAILPPLAALAFVIILDYTLVFHDVERENLKHHNTAVRMTCAGIGLMSVLVLFKMNADIHLCGHDLSILQQLPVIVGSWTLVFGFLSMIYVKFRKPYRPTPTLEADSIPPLPTDASAVAVLIFEDRIKTFAQYGYPHMVADRQDADDVDVPPAVELQGDAISPVALDSMAVKKKIMDTVEPVEQFEEAVMLVKDAVLVVALHFFCDCVLAALLFFRAIHTFVVDVPPAMKSHCVERFNASFLDEPPLVIGAIIVLQSLLNALRRPGRDLKAAGAGWVRRKWGALVHIWTLFRFFVSHEYPMLGLFVVWIGLEVLDLLVVRSGYFTAPNFLNLLFHVIMGPLLLVLINYNTLILSPFRKLRKLHTLANRFILLAMALDISLLYIKLYIGRNFSCNHSAFSAGRVLLMQTSVAVTGVCTVALLKKYIDLFLYPTRPCMTTGSRTKFLIVENVVTASVAPIRRRDALLKKNRAGSIMDRTTAIHSSTGYDLVVEDADGGDRKSSASLTRSDSSFPRPKPTGPAPARPAMSSYGDSPFVMTLTVTDRPAGWRGADRHVVHHQIEIPPLPALIAAKKNTP